MSTKYWRWSIVWAMALIFSQAGAAPVTIGIPLPHGQVQGEEMTESMRQSLISQLKAQSIDAVPLSAPTGGLEAEVQAKHCNYVLYTRVQNKHSTGSGVFGKLSMLTHGISPNAIGAWGRKRQARRYGGARLPAHGDGLERSHQSRLAERQSRFGRTRRRESSGRATDQRRGCGGAGQGSRARHWLRRRRKPRRKPHRPHRATPSPRAMVRDLADFSGTEAFRMRKRREETWAAAWTARSSPACRTRPCRLKLARNCRARSKPTTKPPPTLQHSAQAMSK